MQKIFVPILFLILFSKVTCSQQYFDFNLNKKYLYQDNELETQFVFNFEGYNGKDFIVRPKTERGSIEIYDANKNIWIKHNDLWSNMPKLEKNMKIKLNLVGKSEVSFEIQNTIDAKIYKTSKKTVWGGDIFGNYIKKINKNVFRYNVQEKKQTPLVHVSAKEKTPGLLAKMIKYIDEII